MKNAEKVLPKSGGRFIEKSGRVVAAGGVLGLTMLGNFSSAQASSVSQERDIAINETTMMLALPMQDKETSLTCIALQRIDVCGMGKLE